MSICILSLVIAYNTTYKIQGRHSMKKEKLIVLNTFELMDWINFFMPLHTPQYSNCLEEMLTLTENYSDMFYNMFYYYFGKEAILDDFSPIQILERVLTSLLAPHDICVDRMYWKSLFDPGMYSTEYTCYMELSDTSIQVLDELMENEAIHVVHKLANRKEILCLKYAREEFRILTYEDFSNIVREKLFRAGLTENFKIEVLTSWNYDTFEGKLALTFNTKKDLSQIFDIIIKMADTQILKNHFNISLNSQIEQTYIGIAVNLHYFVPIVHKAMGILDTTNIVCSETAFLSCCSKDRGSKDIVALADLVVSYLTDMYDMDNATTHIFEPIHICQ